MGRTHAIATLARTRRYHLEHALFDVNESSHTTESQLTLAPPGALMEFERLRSALGFTSQEPRLIDGRYRVDETLGRGAMGEVVLAYDHRLERQVALKLVRSSVHISAQTLRTRLEREAVALARVDHVNVIGIHDVGTHEDQPYFTMQFVPGANLREWQGERARSPAELLDVYLQAARGLEAAHRGGVVHRDFKPDNVLVGEDGIVRVLDFGIAAALRPELDALAPARDLDAEAVDTAPGSYDSKAAGGTAPGPGSGLAPMTRAGTLLGTLPYMSPEQLEGRKADVFSDQFGFCIALWEALTGARPYSGRSVARLSEAIAKGPEGEAKLPRWLRPLLIRGLALDPRGRWPSMAALIDAIERRRHRGRRVGLVVGLGLSLAGATALGRSSVEPVEPGQSCADYLASVDASWTSERRAALERGGAASRYAVTSIDVLVEGWKGRAAQHCREELAPSPQVPARACLDAWVESFDSTLELLVERGDARTLARAPDLLARLVPPNGDDCALRPQQPVDPEVWRLAERSYSLILLGDMEAAAEQGEASLARAQELQTGLFDLERGVAQLARARVGAYTGAFETAGEALGHAERHALASQAPELMLETWTFAAKVEMLRARGELAQGFARRAEPLAEALELPPEDPRRAELLEAQGMAARALDEQELAIAYHAQARDLFVDAGQPTLAVKSLINMGANYRDLGSDARAREVYAEAVTLLERADLPPSYPNRVLLERDLGLLADQAESSEAIRAGLTHFEFVLAHGTEAQKIDALELLISISTTLEDRALAVRWSEAALARIERTTPRPVTPEEHARLEAAAALALAVFGDPRGEQMLEVALARASELGPVFRFNLQAGWITWLELERRCPEALARRRALEDEMNALDPDHVPSDYFAWAEAGPANACIP